MILSRKWGVFFIKNHSFGIFDFLIIKFILWVDCKELNLSLVFIFVLLYRKKVDK